MSIKNEGPAGWAVHPGEILREEFLEPMGISAYRLAVELRVSPPTVNDIVREKRNYSRDGRPAGQVFRDFRAVLAQFAGCFCGSSGQREASQGAQGHQALCRRCSAIATLSIAERLRKWRVQGSYLEGVQSGSRRTQNPVE